MYGVCICVCVSKWNVCELSVMCVMHEWSVYVMCVRMYMCVCEWRCSVCMYVTVCATVCV